MQHTRSPLARWRGSTTKSRPYEGRDMDIQTMNTFSLSYSMQAGRIMSETSHPTKFQSEPKIPRKHVFLQVSGDFCILRILSQFNVFFSRCWDKVGIKHLSQLFAQSLLPASPVQEIVRRRLFAATSAAKFSCCFAMGFQLHPNRKRRWSSI